MAHATEDDDQRSPTALTAPVAAPLTPAWLTQVLGRPSTSGTGGAPARVLDVRVEPLGVGIGLLGTLHRLELAWSDDSGPSRVVVKGPAEGASSRAVASLFGMHRTEVGFYRDLAAATGVAVPCHHTASDEVSQDFVLVLADQSGDTTFDQLEGCPPDRARTVVTALADLHARYWDGAGLAPATWLRPLDHADLVDAFRAALRTTWPEVRAGFPDDVAPIIEIGDRLEALIPLVAATLSRAPITLTHGDARLDNVFFGGPDRVMLCDWQLTGTSRGPRDLAYFLTQSLTTDDRVSCERPLFDEYLARLAARGVTGYGPEQAWIDYRAGTLLGLVYAVIASGGLDHATPRATALARAMLQRSVAAAVDHDCTSLG
ncbi:MAG: phosphotransferase [Acidimicrobiales bacterium]|nr:phosphotransferase [Acidimicrobiales bacterium]